VKIGKNCKIVSLTGIAGNVTIGDRVTIYGQSSVANHVVIEDDVVVMGRTAVTKSIKKGEMVSGPWGRDHLTEKKMFAKINKMFKEKEK
jgi:UDP-3-O-[3-hydroxymyristoyl] glucosamine N-acyltransferase